MSIAGNGWSDTVHCSDDWWLKVRMKFRFHLLTLVLTSIAAGGIIQLNTVCGAKGSRNVWGWPFDCAEQWRMSTDLPPPFPSEDNIRHFAFNWLPMGICEDIASGCLLLAAIAFVSEFLIRPREGRGP